MNLICRVSEVDNFLLEVYCGLASRHRERRKAAHALSGCASRRNFACNGGDGEDDDNEENDDDEEAPPRESSIGIRPAVDAISSEEVSQ